MRLVLLTHPTFFGTVSQPRFAEMIARGMSARGHTVEQWTAPARFSRLPVTSDFVRKWLGYVDQYLLFPRELRRRIAAQPADTVFVVTDQALGMWVPHLAPRPHVIHCHDFLALRCALDEFPEQRVSRSGKHYQRLIRNGFSQGRAFISVSQKTREDLHRLLPHRPPLSEVVYNGLNHLFRPMAAIEAEKTLSAAGIKISAGGCLLHVGGNQWYKNRRGVLEIYRAYVARVSAPVPLWMVGASPSVELRVLADSIPGPGCVHFLSGLNNEQVNAAYAVAKALLFPSLEEGFGWPIAEAMAAGCPVITANAAPMTEVAGDAARLIPRRPARNHEQRAWAEQAAGEVAEVLQMSDEQRAGMIQRGLQNTQRFDAEKTLSAYERIYRRVGEGKSSGGS